MKQKLKIPHSKLSGETEEERLKKKREELKQRLAGNLPVKVNTTGTIIIATPTPSTTPTVRESQIPTGKLASPSFYWYENDIELFEEEKKAMNYFFPTFEIEKLSDGRYSWFGTLKPNLIGNNNWSVQAIYDHDHPHNNSFGGSVKVYLVDPDLDTLEENLGVTIPHTLSDSKGNKYLCTSEDTDFIVTTNKTTSAASCILWAVKWISVFELYVGGEITYSEFAGHGKF